MVYSKALRVQESVHSFLTGLSFVSSHCADENALDKDSQSSVINSLFCASNLVVIRILFCNSIFADVLTEMFNPASSQAVLIHFTRNSCLSASQ